MNNKGIYTQQKNNGESSHKLIYFEVGLLKYLIETSKYNINYSVKYDISIKFEYDNDETVEEKDKFILDNVGLGFDENNERIFAVFLKGLSELHPEMQNRFNSYETTKKTYLDPSYIKSINGEWSSSTSIFEVILYQIKKINDICVKINQINNNVIKKEINNNCVNINTPLFKLDYEENRPLEFNPLIFFTKKEYYNFMMTFDKILSDNFNKKFFENMESKKKANGTIKLFKEWLNENGVDPEIIEKTIKIINEIRKERSKASHNLIKNEWNLKYYQKQIDIVLEVYKTFRLLIDELTKIKQIEVKHDEWYTQNKIDPISFDEIKIKDNENYQLSFHQEYQLKLKSYSLNQILNF